MNTHKHKYQETGSNDNKEKIDFQRFQNHVFKSIVSIVNIVIVYIHHANDVNNNIVRSAMCYKNLVSASAVIGDRAVYTFIFLLLKV